MKDFTIGIDIGGTNFRIGTVDKNGNVFNFEKLSSRIFDNENVVKVIYDTIQNYIDKYNLDKKIGAISVGIPATISKDKKTIISTPNLKGFNNICLGKELQEMINLPVFLDRDVNFLLMNDIEKLNIDSSKTILGFYVGTGFGNAIYIDGNIYSGKNGAEGELGHIPFIDIDDVCTCGNVGCAETRCSGRYLELIAQNYFPETLIREVFKYHADDPRIIKFVEDLAIPIATEINILDPDYAIVAGGVVFMENFPKDILIESIHKKIRKPYPEQNLNIIFSEHNQQSGIIGSGIFAHKKLGTLQN